ncbi:MAG: GH3 auxin-responsive promoter family protein [Dehalococcoidales bacterium]|nr:GH3 auxin-responsive promoter family protein [Dehalococcoidales bacterium]
MPRAVELLRQGRGDELWQMCCGFTDLNLEQFMVIQKRLLLEQIGLLNRSVLGRKIMHGARPETIEEFRRDVPLTTYADYCPELLEKREDVLPVKPAFWSHSSGRSGEYPFKWIPITPAFSEEMSSIMYGVGILSSCREQGDISHLMECPNIVYTVAPRPYITGALASMLEQQSPSNFLPPLEESESMSFEDRIKLGFKQALSAGLDYFFGLSLVLVTVGNRFSESSNKVDIRPLLSQPKALFRLAKGMVKSKLARRPMLPRDLWSVKGILCGGLDSWVYRDKIKKLWGRYPLDVYVATEAGFIATQTWDCTSMTFVPSLNFLEFIPEKEHLKWQLDHSYQPKTVLLNEVKPEENYELVITNFHGGAMVRYRPGDMLRITSLKNEILGIEIPQMTFERRADGLIDFVFIRLTEKTIWQAIENTGIAYEDWAAYKKPGEPILSLLIELKDGYRGSEADIASAVYEQIINSDNDKGTKALIRDDFAEMINFKVEVNLLPRGAFANYAHERQAEGADLAHLKPPHLNPSQKVLSLLFAKPEGLPEVMVRDEPETVAVR